MCLIIEIVISDRFNIVFIVTVRLFISVSVSICHKLVTRSCNIDSAKVVRCAKEYAVIVCVGTETTAAALNIYIFVVYKNLLDTAYFFQIGKASVWRSVGKPCFIFCVEVHNAIFWCQIAWTSWHQANHNHDDEVQRFFIFCHNEITTNQSKKGDLYQ